MRHKNKQFGADYAKYDVFFQKNRSYLLVVWKKAVPLQSQLNKR